MLQSLDLNLYLDGYNFEQINCVDLPIAALAGYYNNENYYNYCFYYAFYNNWDIPDTKNVQTFRNEILKKLGMKMNSYKIEDNNNLFSFIKESIDDKIPILFLASYRSLFYYSNYKEENGSHGVIISGYDSERSLIIIRDSKVVDRMENPSIDELLSADPFYKLQLTEDMLSNIWFESNKIYKEDNESLYNTIFRIEKMDKLKILSFYDVIEEFIHNFNPSCSKLITFVKKINIIRDNRKNDSVPFDYYRRVFYHSINVIFDFLEKFYKIEGTNTDKYNNYYKFKNEYLNFRSILLAKLHKNSLKGIVLEESSINLMIQKILEMDNKLYNMINELHLNYNKSINVKNKELINYALNSIASADSGFILPTHNVSSADNAVNGEWTNWLTDLWHSSKENEIHWLKIDLGKRPVIKKFVIRHFGRKTLNTRDFKIQGSDDNISWNNMVIVDDNDNNITTHEIEGAQYRYVRLYITNPCIDGDAARIFEFEVWGI